MVQHVSFYSDYLGLSLFLTQWITVESKFKMIQMYWNLRKDFLHLLINQGLTVPTALQKAPSFHIILCFESFHIKCSISKIRIQLFCMFCCRLCAALYIKIIVYIY